MFGDVAFAQAPFAALGGRTLASAVDENAAGTEVVDSLSALGGLIDETATVFESEYSASNTLTALMAETVAASAAQTVIARMLASQAEGAQATNTQTANYNGHAALAESAQGTDAYAGNAELYAAITELASALDEVNGGRGFFVDVAEYATAADEVSVSVVFAGTVAEFARAASTFAVKKTLNVQVTGVQLVVSIGDVLIWAVIDDTQNPNWQNINDTQSPGWTDIPS